MRTASDLQHDVMEELAFDPSLAAGGIGVSVTGDGVVTLNGHVGSYTERIAAEEAAKRVNGVRGVANDLTVRLWPGSERDDTAIAEAAVHALKWNTQVPVGAVTPTASSGWVTLEGTVDWQYQKDAARRAVENITGVRGVSSLVTLRQRVLPIEVERRVQSAFQRAASLDAKHVHVEAIGSRVVLSGTVRSWPERTDAERAAWSVPGVTQVENNLSVGAAAYAVV